MSQMMVAVFSLLWFLYCQCVLHSSQSLVIRVTLSIFFSGHVEVAGAEIGGCQGGHCPPKFCLAPPVASPNVFRSLSESPTQTIDSSPCGKTGPSSGPPK